MNREQKIALIIGFAVILVVGVLVSDHLSRARQLQLADATEGDAPGYRPQPVAMLGDQFPREAGFAVAARRVPSTTEPAEPAIDSVAAGQESAPVVVIDQGGENGSPLERSLASGSPESRSFLHDLGERWRNGLSEGIQSAASVGNDEFGGLSPLRRAEEPRIPTVGTRPEVVPTKVASTPVRHRVARNESLFAIAKKYYGDGNRWKAIAAANRDLVDADGNVREGRLLTIPDGTALGQTGPARAGAAPTEPAPPKRYVVQKNDTLGEIAQKMLGSVKRTGDLLAANRDKIDDPNDIYVGMVLAIPG